MLLRGKDLKDKSKNSAKFPLVHAHICPICGRASRREDPDGMPDAAGVFHCSQCGHEGPLNIAVIEEIDDRFRR
jgi:hypothetical protein